MRWTATDLLAGLLQILEENKNMTEENIEGEYENLAKSFSLLVPAPELMRASCKI